jgi:PAS domain S-box-containing protein
MTEAMASLELNKFMTNNMAQGDERTNKRPLVLGGILAVALLIGCYVVSDILINRKQAELLSELQARQEIAVSGRADVIKTWLDETSQRANLITRSPLLQLFATEVNKSGSGNLAAPLKNQLPFMQNAITSFVKENGMIGAYLIDKDGRAYLASNKAPALTDGQRKLAVTQYDQHNIGLSDLRLTNDQLLFDVLIPVHAPQANITAQSKSISGVFVMTLSASKHLSEILQSSGPVETGQQTLLFQKNENAFFAVTPERAPYLGDTANSTLNGNFEAFSLSVLSDGSQAVYTSGKIVADTNWVLLQTLPKETALADLQTYSYVVYGMAGSFFLVVLSIISGVWFSLKSQNARAMADQYKELAQQINAQRRLLGSINGTIDDLIGLTDSSGRYVYSNPALARFVDFPEASIAGKTDREIFGDKTARLLDSLNRQVMDTGHTANDILEINSPRGDRIVRVEKSKLLDDDNNFMGIVTVVGDITDYITHQRQKEELGRKTISILVHMMEDNDPYLAGHSQRMGELSNSVSDILDINREDRQTIATAANLSQIGKINIPVEIRTKESRLTDAEMTIMRGHVDKAGSILSEMELGEDIITAVTQMYERQDGSGYPKQLSGVEIATSARILGMADILVARVSPRSYRQAISIEEAMEVFRSNPEKYDPKVVVAFDKYLQSASGAEFKENLETNNRA